MKFSASLLALLAAIRKHEAPRSYGQVYSGARGVNRNADVSKMTLDGVLAFQAQMLAGKSASTACGGYQFLRKTLAATIKEMDLSGNEIWTPDLQDRMAVHLMRNRGLDKFMAGALSVAGFANNLAKEWASLPVVSGKGKGKSYYHGDGLNKCFHKPETILALVAAVKAGGPYRIEAGAPISTQATTPAPASEALPEAKFETPMGLLKAFLKLLSAIFSKKG